MPINLLFKDLEKIKMLSPDLKEFLRANIKTVSVKKNMHLYNQDIKLNKVYYIVSGLIVGNIFIEDRQHTCWFLKESDFVTDLQSFINQGATSKSAIAAEDSILLYLTYAEAYEMFERFNEANCIARILITHYHCKNNKRTELLMILKTVNRYHKFAKQQKWALKRIKLGYIASYLNMTREQLSRVRRS
jgi:CRP-like cAMP-binding protein